MKCGILWFMSGESEEAQVQNKDTGGWCSRGMARFLPVWVLLLLTVGMIVLAFPRCAEALHFQDEQTIGVGSLLTFVVVVGLGLYGLIQRQVVRDFCRKQWLAGLFHLGVLCVLIGGTLTALAGRNLEVELAPKPEGEPQVLMDETWVPLDEVANAPHILPEWRMLWIAGRWLPIYPYTMEHLFSPNLERFPIAAPWSEDVATLEDVEVETYPNGMPKQYRTRLAFEEGSYEIAVNQPLRRKGLTYYQMSYAQSYLPAVDRYGSPIYFRTLDLDAKGEPQFDAQGRPIYKGDGWEHPVGFPSVSTQLSVRKDPGAPITFAGYGLLILATFLFALREERR